MVVNKSTSIKMMTSSAQYVDLNKLKTKDISITDVAQALSNLCRYNGHTNKFYSVAEHSVRLTRYAINMFPDGEGRTLAKALLLHDATEAYVGDVIYPLKQYLPEFSKLENKIGETIFKKFDIKLTEEQEVKLKELDRRICFDEMYVLFNGSVDVKLYEEGIRPLGLQYLFLSDEDSLGWSPSVAYNKFLIVAEYLGLYERPKQVLAPEAQPATPDSTNNEKKEEKNDQSSPV